MQLRDIFRIHPDAACNTHDLLECSCDSAMSMDDDSDLVPIIDDEKMPEMGFVCASDVPTVDPDVAEQTVSDTLHLKCLLTHAVE